MIVRSKTKVRLLILLAGLALLVGGGATVYVVRKQRIHNYYLGRRADGMAQYQKGDYASTLVMLGPYIRREEFSKDADAIYAFADARRHVEMPNGRHLAQAMTTLQRVLSLQPDRTDVKRQLLDLYTQLGYNIEAGELADKLLVEDKNDLQALRAKARGLFGRQLSREAQDVCNQVNLLVPLDLEMRVLALEILRDLNERPKILETALETHSKNPNDPRAELILSIACSFTEEMSPAQRDQLADLIKTQYPQDALPRILDSFHFSQFFATKAAQRDLSDLILVRYLVGQLDGTRLVWKSLDVLQKADVQYPGTWVQQFLIRRLWESGQFTDVLTRMEKMEIHGSTPGEIELLAIRGVSQARTDQKENASKSAATLAGFNDDRVAQAWATIIRELVLKTDGNAREVIDTIRLAFEVQRNNAYLRFYQGLAYLELGELDAAMEAFSQVTTARPLWQQPLIQLSRLQLEAGQKQTALENASEAYGINDSLAAASNLAIVATANADFSTLTPDSDLIKFVAHIQRKFPGEETTLPVYVQLLAKTKQPEEARKVINYALASETPPSASAFLRLAAVSRECNLGLDEDCYKAAEESAGLTPQIALARANSMAEAGNTDAAARYLQESMQKTGPTDATWRLAWATFLEQTKDERAAAAAWIALADDPALKSNVNVQRDALSAPSIQKDTAFISRTIERIRALTGEQSIGWKMAQARLLMRDPAKAKSPEQIKSLSEIVTAAPGNIEARMLLAAAHEKAGNISAAVEQITAARKLQPSSKTLSLDLARLYMAQLDFQRAREIVSSIPPNALEPAPRRVAGRLIGQQGNISLAITFMEGAMADAPAADRLYLAELYRRANKHPKAEAIYKSLLEKPDRIEVVMAAADYYASRGQDDLARQALAHLEKLQLKPAEKDFALAEYSSRHGNADEALTSYQAVVKSDPTKPNGWRALIAEYLGAGKIDEAVEAARLAIRALPAEEAKPFHNVISSAATLKELAPEKSLVRLMSSVMEPSPDGEAAAAALPIIAEGIRTKATAELMTTRLRDIAERAPRLAALQMLLVQNYLLSAQTQDPAKREAARNEAVRIALRSLSVSPASPEIARNAAQAVFFTGNFAKALAPAQQWRELTPENTLPADLFIAELHMYLEDYVSVLRDLQPYAEDAKANPANNEFAFVNTFRAQALIMRGDDVAAAELLGPFLNTQPRMRAVWRELGQFLPNPIAQKWIERLAAATPADQTNEQIDLAIAWHGLFTGRARFAGSGDPKHKQAAVAILDRLATTAPDHPFVIQARALLAQAENRLGAAEQGYRRALELKPDLPVCLNNLAMMICERGDHKEALSLAQRAVAVSPLEPSIRDTLAYVQLKMKDYPKAQESFKVAAILDPKNIKWRIKLAQAYDEAGQVEDLATTLDEIEKMMPDTKVTEPQRDTVRQLRTKVQKTASR